MALVNPQGLYSGGNVQFDSSPYVQFEYNMLAKKRAKDEALNQYFNELGSKINTAGVRQQDLDGEHGGINRDIQNWQSNWIKNKEAIKKGGMAQQAHMRQYQDILRRVGQSKERAKTLLEMGKAKFEGKYDPDDDDLNVMDKVNRSIYDPGSYKDDGVSEYGWGDTSPAVGQFDALKQSQFWGAAERGSERGKVYDFKSQRVDPSTGKAIVPFSEQFAPEQVRQIAENAGGLLASSREAKKHYQKMLKDIDAPTFERLNKAYRSVYGEKDMPDTPEKLAKADAILRATTPSKSGEEAFTDLNTANKIWQDRRRQTQQDAFARIKFRKSLGGSDDEDDDTHPGNVFIQESLDAIEEGDMGKVQKTLATLEKGGKYIDFNAKVDGADIVVSYKVPEGVDSEGDVVGGQVITRRFKNDENLPQQLKGFYQASTGADNKFEKSPLPKKKPAAAPKTYSYKGKTYSEQQLSDAAKKSGMTVEEYKKELGIK